MITNIIFDWSGPIIDVVPALHYLVNRIFAQYGIPEISIVELKTQWQQPYMKFYNKYLPNLSLEEEQTAYMKALATCPPQQAWPGIPELIKQLSARGITMAVLSSDPTEYLMEQMDRLELNGIFAEVLSNVHDKRDGTRQLANSLHLAPEETIIIGDSTHEIEAGKAAGILTGVVTWGIQNEDALRAAHPDYIFHTVQELEQVILGG